MWVLPKGVECRESHFSKGARSGAPPRLFFFFLYISTRGFCFLYNFVLQLWGTVS